MNGDKRPPSESESADDRVGEALRLDGNVAAGILSEVDPTGARLLLLADAISPAVPRADASSAVEIGRVGRR